MNKFSNVPFSTAPPACPLWEEEQTPPTLHMYLDFNYFPHLKQMNWPGKTFCREMHLAACPFSLLWTVILLEEKALKEVLCWH